MITSFRGRTLRLVPLLKAVRWEKNLERKI